MGAALPNSQEGGSGGEGCSRPPPGNAGGVWGTPSLPVRSKYFMSRYPFGSVFVLVRFVCIKTTYDTHLDVCLLHEPLLKKSACSIDEQDHMLPCTSRTDRSTIRQVLLRWIPN
jgi:hypothetical protein